MERETPPQWPNPYRAQTKARGVTQCSRCKAVRYAGRWLAQSDADPSRIDRIEKSRSKNLICPACRQAKERYALGVLIIEGEVKKEKLKLVLETIANTEKIAKSRNNQQRILWQEKDRGKLRFYVSLPRLAEKLGRELARSFKGQVRFQKTRDDPFIRVVWTVKQEEPVQRRQRAA